MDSFLNISGLLSVLFTNRHNLLLFISVALTVPIAAANQASRQIPLTNTSIESNGFCGNNTMAVSKTLEQLNEAHIQPFMEWSRKANNDVCNSWAVDMRIAAENPVPGLKFCKGDAVLPINSDKYKPEVGHLKGCKDCFNFARTVTQILNASELLSNGLLTKICAADTEMSAEAKKKCAQYMKELLFSALDASSTFMSYEVLCKLVTGQCISEEEKPYYETKMVAGKEVRSCEMCVTMMENTEKIRKMVYGGYNLMSATLCKEKKDCTNKWEFFLMHLVNSTSRRKDHEKSCKNIGCWNPKPGPSECYNTVSNSWQTCVAVVCQNAEYNACTPNLGKVTVKKCKGVDGNDHDCTTMMCTPTKGREFACGQPH